MCFLGLKKLVEPFYNGFPDTKWWDDYPANFPLAQQVYDQGGAVSYAHPGMSPVLDSASIKEMPIDLALGHQTAMDVLSNSDEAASMQMWYRLLNCGFRVPISAGTDSFTNVADHYIAGGGRVYVQAGPRFDYPVWLDAFRKGRSFASNGPMVWLTVNGFAPGDEVRLSGPGKVDGRGHGGKPGSGRRGGVDRERQPLSTRRKWRARNPSGSGKSCRSTAVPGWLCALSAPGIVWC